MVRTYKRKLGAHGHDTYKDEESEEKLNEALQLVNDGVSIKRAAELAGVPRSTLGDKIRNLHPSSVCHPTVYSAEEENSFEEVLIKCSDMGFPFGVRDLKFLVHAYNCERGRNVIEFKDDAPGDDWVKGFLGRHPDLTQRLANNIKRARAEVDRPILEQYFGNLEVVLIGLIVNRIFNYDETNFTDDPGEKRVIVKRGMKHVDRVMDSTKTAVSIMFCGSADGTILPPYVCYKALNVWSSWGVGGPVGDPFCSCRACERGCGYNQTPHGWFDARTFVEWFKSCFLPHTRGIEGRKAIIGDNLSSHLTGDVLQLARENDISFICLPPNSTHLTQPLDVAFFRPLKNAWRRILEDYKRKTKSPTLDKSEFPKLLRALFQDSKVKPVVQRNLISGFRATGIWPFNPEVVLSKLPAGGHLSSASSSSLSDATLEVLKQMRFRSDRRKTGCGEKLIGPPGTSLSHWEREEGEDNGNNDPGEGTSSSVTVRHLSSRLEHIWNELWINQEDPRNLDDDDDDEYSSDSDTSLNL